MHREIKMKLEWQYSDQTKQTLKYGLLQDMRQDITYDQRINPRRYNTCKYTCTQDKSTGEGNGTPLQGSCLETPRHGGAGWAAIYGVTQSQTRLKRLTSSSSSSMYKHMCEYVYILGVKVYVCIYMYECNYTALVLSLWHSRYLFWFIKIMCSFGCLFLHLFTYSAPISHCITLTFNY